MRRARENVATIFGSLFKSCDPADVLADARRFMTTATYALRFIKVSSGDEASLLPATVLVPTGVIAHHRASPKRVPRDGAVPLAVRRFKVAKISRPLRRALLGVLEAIDRDRLLEDMLCHRSYWVWVGEFLSAAQAHRPRGRSHDRPELRRSAEWPDGASEFVDLRYPLRQ